MTAFADSFVLFNMRFTRCQAPHPTRLSAVSNKSISTGELLGKINLQTFADHDARRGYARLYHFETGESSWYEIDWNEAIADSLPHGSGGEE